MSKERNTRMLRIQYVSLLVLALVPVLLFETDTWPMGVWVGYGSTYLWQVVLQLLTLAVIPLSLKLLAWTPVRRQIRSGQPDALRRYLYWASVRLWSIGLLLWANLFYYYLACDTSGAFCALLLLLALMFCWPSAAKQTGETEPAESQIPER